MKKLIPTFLAAICATFVLPQSGAAAETATRVWQLHIAGQPSGSFTEESVRTPDGKVKTKETMALEMNRLGSKVTIRTESETLEGSDGTVEAVNGSVSSSQAATVTRAVRAENGFEVETEAGGKSYRKTVPVSGTVLGPKGVEQLSREKLGAAGATVSFQVFSIEAGGVASLTRTAVERVTEGDRQLLVLEETIEGMAGKQLITLDENGRWVRRSQMLPFGEMTMRPASDSAPAATATTQPLPAESYDRTMARSNILLPDARTLTAVKLHLRHNQPELGWPALDSPTQRVVEQTPTTRVVEVRGFTAPRGAKGEPPDESYLRPNALVQSDDPEVIRIAQEVTAGATSDFEKARRLQDWVSSNLQFDLGIAVAPASELVRNRRGTCIAYATLLAALQRVVGLPSRIAMGYGYANGIWGGHAWTEAFIDGEWVALDAALYGPGTADAARLWFGSSSGDDQLMKVISAGAQMYGAVEFRVLSFEQNGRTIEVPEKASPFTVNGSRYANPWLGFVVEAPKSFRVTKTDAVFPDPAIVQLEDGSGGRIAVGMSNVGADEAAAKKRALGPFSEAELRLHKVGKFEGEAAATAEGVRFIWRRGNSFWAITAEGKNASALLEQIATSWKWTR